MGVECMGGPWPWPIRLTYGHCSCCSIFFSKINKVLNDYDLFENGVVNHRFLTASFAGIRKWNILYVFLGCSSPLWLKLTMFLFFFLLLKYFSSISVFLKFIILWTPSQFSLKKSKIDGHWFTLHVTFVRIEGQFLIDIQVI